MREAIAQYVEREERREALNRETAVAWDEYQATGKHVTSEAVNEWLNTWGEVDERSAPTRE